MLLLLVVQLTPLQVELPAAALLMVAAVVVAAALLMVAADHSKVYSAADRRISRDRDPLFFF
jgi:hypothetical protein